MSDEPKCPVCEARRLKHAATMRGFRAARKKAVKPPSGIKLDLADYKRATKPTKPEKRAPSSIPKPAKPLVPQLVNKTNGLGVEVRFGPGTSVPGSLAKPIKQPKKAKG